MTANRRIFRNIVAAYTDRAAGDIDHAQPVRQSLGAFASTDELSTVFFHGVRPHRARPHRANTEFKRRGEKIHVILNGLTERGRAWLAKPRAQTSERRLSPLLNTSRRIHTCRLAHVGADVAIEEVKV